MPRFQLSLTFFDEPFRLIEWTDKSNRNSANTQWMRGQGFARWHKITLEKGFPFVTGTAVRSKIIREVEALLSRNKGTWNGIPCCSGFFDTKGPSPTHLRYRPTLEWEYGKTVCTSEADVCPLCLLLGRFDQAGKKSDTPCQSTDYHVHWENLSAGVAQYRLEDIAQKRTSNRVDFFSKKAHDHYGVWEVTAVKNLLGYIYISDAITESHQKTVISLLKAALSFTDTLCGANCKLELSDEPVDSIHSNQSASNFNPHSGAAPSQCSQSMPPFNMDQETKELANTLCKAFTGNMRHLRTLADAVREMRRMSPGISSLPRGRLNKEGEITAHYLWDERIDEKTIRQVLEDTIELSPARSIIYKNWISFCNQLGQKLYERAKDNDPILERKRPLGEAAFSKVPTSSHAPRHDMNSRVKGGFTREWIIVGTLRALTPFYMGTGSQAGKQTSMPTLQDSNDHFRLPRTALRGALRRDINQASDGMGCVVELGPHNLCSCPVCQVLRQIRLLDTKSKFSMPPAIRQKICKNPVLSIVNEGSLFDVELGIEGETFPFVMRYRGGAKIPDTIITVLSWWKNERLFIGGESGTGRGRFVLECPRIFCWDVEKGQNDYIQYHGFRNKEDELLSVYSTVSGLAEKNDVNLNNARDFSFDKICWEVQFDGPVLTGDPLAALFHGNTDSVFYKKPILKSGEKEPSYQWAIKSDTVRGLIRSAFGKRDALLIKSHEDCDCLLCEAFGSKHHEGKLRFEDLTPKSDEIKTYRMDHVAIDRISGGAVDQCKYDDEPLVGTSKHPLVFKGMFWINRDSSVEMQRALIAAFKEIRDGLYPLGSNGGTGYGWISHLAITNGPDWLNLEEVPLPQPTADIPVEECTAEPYPKFQKPDLDQNAVYYPHYFLQPGKPAERERHPVSHDHIDDKLLTGRLVCTLTTKTPLIIPDTQTNTMLPPNDAPEGHKSFRFFRIDDEVLIPGSEIRGMVSTVFEALTGSCFRVINQKAHLSWRINADMAKHYRPGRIIQNNEKMFIQPYKMFRLPFYAGFDPRNCLSEKQLLGIEPVKLWVKDFVASLVKPQTDIDIEWKEKIGFVRVTGPNKVEVDSSNTPDPSLPECESDWKDIHITEDGSTPSKNDRVYRCQLKGVTYTVAKWCEAFWVKDEGKKPITVNAEAINRYHLIMKSYQDNPQSPPIIFRSLPVLNYKQDQKIIGSMIFYRESAKSDKIVNEIIPVKISRTADTELLAKHLPNNDFLPCAATCLNECDTCNAKTCKFLPLYREGYPVNGLCPSCHLFGTTGYQGRVRFGFAKMNGNAKFCQGGERPEDRAVTLPLQERPKLTWVMPNENSTIPGRKFFLHHQGWKKIVDEGKNPINGDVIEPDANNRTVEPLAAGNDFSFEVFFENLREWELGLLRYTLELESELAHKLGMGKAFGFGSVKIKIKSVDLRKQGEWEKATNTLVSEDKKSSWYNIHTVNNLRTALYYVEDDKIQVNYPKLKKDNESDNRPGYVEMKKTAFPVRDILTTPWWPWWPPTPPPMNQSGNQSYARSEEPARITESQPEVYKTGTVKFYKHDKKFGFITMDGRENIHFAGNQICRPETSLQSGDKVKFIEGENYKGPTALKVERLKG